MGERVEGDGGGRGWGERAERVGGEGGGRGCRRGEERTAAMSTSTALAGVTSAVSVYLSCMSKTILQIEK